MMRPSRPTTAATARKSRAPRTPCEHHFWCSHGARETRDARAAAAADGRFDNVITYATFAKTLHNDAVANA
eukprot:135401-Lingulodinium_polyedra.AAC.1